MRIRLLSFLLFSLVLLPAFLHAEGIAPDSLTVRKITVIGNASTREWVILRELSVSVGDTILRSELERRFKRCEDNLFNTHLFNSVHINWIEEDGALLLYVIVSERWYIFPIPIFEVAERNFNTWWENRDLSRVIYGLSLNWRNVTGRNDLFTSTIRLGYIQRMSLSYSMPNINRKKTMGIGVSGFYLRNREVQIETVNDQPVFLNQDEQYMRREYGGGCGLSYRPGLYESHTGEIYYRHSTTTD